MWAGRGACDVVQGVAEGGQVALGGGIVSGVEDGACHLYGGGGVTPWVGGVRRIPRAVGYLLVKEAFA